MVALLAFSVTLLIAVLLSEYASRSVLSTSVLFLAAGFICGAGVLGFISVVVAASILIHSSTDVLVARWFRTGETEQDLEHDTSEFEPDGVETGSRRSK